MIDLTIAGKEKVPVKNGTGTMHFPAKDSQNLNAQDIRRL